MRPARVARQAVVLTGLGGAFYGVARTTGSGWLVVLVCGVTGALAVATLWPPVALRRVGVAVATARDGTVGRPQAAEVAIVSGGRGCKLRLLEPLGGWVAVDGPSRGEVLVTPRRRGVVHAVDVEVACAAPLGLVWWRRRLRVPLAAPLEVGPRPLPASLEEVTRVGRGGLHGALQGRVGHETVRSVRGYVPGDPIRLVSWTATARWGEVMVKELEDPEVPRLAVVVDLRGDEAEAEEVASRAAGLVGAALEAGMAVRLLTAGEDGPAWADVGTAVEAGRALARAGPGVPAEGPLPEGALVARLDGATIAARGRSRPDGGGPGAGRGGGPAR